MPIASATDRFFLILASWFSVQISLGLARRTSAARARAAAHLEPPPHGRTRGFWVGARFKTQRERRQRVFQPRSISKRFSSSSSTSSGEDLLSSLTVEDELLWQQAGSKRRKRVSSVSRRPASVSGSTESGNETNWEITEYYQEVAIVLDGFHEERDFVDLSALNGRYVLRRDRVAHGRETYWRTAPDGGTERSDAETPFIYWCASDSQRGKVERWGVAVGLMYRGIQEGGCSGLVFFQEGDITKTPLKVQRVAVGRSSSRAHWWDIDTDGMADWAKQITVNIEDSLVRAPRAARDQESDAMDADQFTLSQLATMGVWPDTWE